ncbi:MAG: T9SS type A sorting domain-containing protein, partial [Candidatus Kapabacteria bacterium]|nr:T9SS type A sorting domain-containing protein [Candidatus Kapabacteria bacterium]
WDVPRSTASTRRALVRLTDADNPDNTGFADQSDAAFSIAPAAPEAATPRMGASNLALPLTLTWIGAGTQGASYEVQLSPNGDFSSGVQTVSSSVERAQVNALQGNTTYFWRVRALAGGLQSAWSEVRRFGTSAIFAPSAPVLVSPPGGAQNLETSLVFQWQAATEATEYRLQVSLAQDFSSFVFNGASGDISRVVSSLAFGGTYFWRVQSLNSAGEGSFSEVRRFTTTTTIPTVPTLLLPAEGSVSPLAATFAWTAVPNAAQYVIEVSPQRSFEAISLRQTLAGTRTTTQLQNNAQYFWRVRTLTGGTTGTWSNIGTFLTSATAATLTLAAIPNLTTPANTSVRSSITVIDASASILTFSASSSNPALIPAANVVVSGIGTERTMTITPAQNQTGSAQITLTANNGNQEARQSFTVRVGAAQAEMTTGFRLLAPPNNAGNIYPASVTFRWASALPSVYYNFQIATDLLFIHPLLNEHYTDTTKRITGFSLNRWYYWRVRSLGGEWSPVWSFYTGTLPVQTASFSNAIVQGQPTSGQNASEQLSSQVSSNIRSIHETNTGEYLNVLVLRQYPNPFSSTTTLEYLLPRDAHVRMDICNTLGQTILTPVNSMEQGGLHAVSVVMDKFPSGVYMVRLNVGGQVLTRQMTLIR